VPGTISENSKEFLETNDKEVFISKTFINEV
jgi:hypothetical protein